MYPRAFGAWGVDSVMVAPLRLRNVERIFVGARCAIYEGAWLACEDDAGVIVVEDEVYLGHGCHVHAGESVTIGAGSVLGDRVTVLDAHHVPGELDRIATAGALVIGRSVHVGVNAVIRGSVTIGDGAVIGANSVVTKDVPAGRRWVGARLLD